MNVKITLSTRPEEHPERATILKFVASITVADLAAAATLKLQDFQSAADTYGFARIANEEGSAAADTRGDTARTADGSFDLAFDRWTLSLDDVYGKGFAAKELPHHLGNKQPAQFLKTAYAPKLDLASTLLMYVAVTPRLFGNPQRLQELRDAHTALDLAVTAWNDALRNRADSVRALVTATGAFDKRWGMLVKEIQDTDPALALRIPKFRRTETVPAETVPAEPAPTEPAPIVPVPTAPTE